VIKSCFIKDFIERPVLGINTANYRDVFQGMLDNCAFVAACDSLSKYPFLLKNVLILVRDTHLVKS
jgi:hypothetical protein